MLLLALLLALVVLAYSTRPLPWLLTTCHLLVSLYAGSFSMGIAFSNDLAFLDHAAPWSKITFELKNLSSIFIHNKKETWEEGYASGQWEFLRSVDQIPRFHTIAGMILEKKPSGSRVLDVGCGYGTVYSLIQECGCQYTGIDISSAAVDRCREIFRDDSRCRFEVIPFEEFQPDSVFQVVVLNEVLYYFPLRKIQEIVSHAFRFFDSGDGILIISMNKNSKAKLIWRILSRHVTVLQSICVKNNVTGSYWNVKVCRPARLPPAAPWPTLLPSTGPESPT